MDAPVDSDVNRAGHGPVVLQVVVVGFTASLIGIIFLFADPLTALDGVPRVAVAGAVLAMTGAAVGAVREIRSGRLGDGDDSTSDSPVVRSGRPFVRLWLLGLVGVPAVALLLTLLFMNQPPPGGPWTRWDLFSARDYVFWMVDALLLWSLIVCVIAVARSRGARWESSVLLCAIPGLLALTVLPAIRKIDCPSQIPRDDMLEPLPPGTYVIERAAEDWRGRAEQYVRIQADGEDSEVLESRVGAWYLARGWRVSQTNGSAGLEMEAGPWHLGIHGMKDYQAAGGPTDLGVALSLSHSDSGCDWLS